MWIEIVPFQSIRHRELAYIPHVVILTNHDVLVRVPAADGTWDFIDQVATLVNHLAVEVTEVSLVDNLSTIYNPALRVPREISDHVILIEGALVYLGVLSHPGREIFARLKLVHRLKLVRVHRTNALMSVVWIVILVE